MPRAGANMVAFINENNIRRRRLHALPAHDARPIGLDAGDLDGVIVAAREFGGDNPVIDIEGG